MNYSQVFFLCVSFLFSSFGLLRLLGVCFDGYTYSFSLCACVPNHFSSDRDVSMKSDEIAVYLLLFALAAWYYMVVLDYFIKTVYTAGTNI